MHDATTATTTTSLETDKQFRPIFHPVVHDSYNTQSTRSTPVNGVGKRQNFSSSTYDYQQQTTN